MCRPGGQDHSRNGGFGPSTEAGSRRSPRARTREMRSHGSRRHPAPGHAAGPGRRPGPTDRTARLRHGPRTGDRARLARGRTAGAGAQHPADGAHQHDARLPPQPDDHRVRGVGPRPVLRRPLPARPRHPGARQHRRPVLGAVVRSGGPARRLPRRALRAIFEAFRTGGDTGPPVQALPVHPAAAVLQPGRRGRDRRRRCTPAGSTGGSARWPARWPTGSSPT